MKNKTILVAGLIVVLLIIVGGAFFVFRKPAVKPLPSDDEGGVDVAALPEVDPAVGVNLTARTDGKAVTLTVAKIPSGTDSIEYELSYTTGAGLPKGAIGKIDVSGKSDISREILLGTCSKNVCTYDAGVAKVTLVLKFNSSKGSSQFNKEFSLNGATQGGTGTEPAVQTPTNNASE